MIRLKTEKDLMFLRKSGKILTDILGLLRETAKDGVSLSYLNDVAEKMLKRAGAKSAFYGYKPKGPEKSYPAHICTSLNNEIVHGIPKNRYLQSGDVLKIDLGVDYKGYITDAAITFGIGDISEEARRLISATRSALAEAVSICKPGIRLGDIGWIIEKTIKENGFKVIKNLTGHGVGFELHEEPTIFNYGEKGTGLELEEGMVLAIEPMASISSEDIKKMPDGSYATKDDSLSAHFEKTVAITKKGAEILTPW